MPATRTRLLGQHASVTDQTPHGTIWTVCRQQSVPDYMLVVDDEIQAITEGRPLRQSFEIDLTDWKTWPGIETSLIAIVAQYAWPAGATIQPYRDGRWSARLDNCGCRYSHRDLAAVHEMITAAAR